MELPDGIDPARAWLAAFLGGLVVVATAAVAFPRRVYDGFLWRYFWGPVDADAHGATCAVRAGGATERLYSQTACSAADGVSAVPGYTTVSTASYAIVLVFMLVGVLLLLRRLNVRLTPQFYVALLPYMLLGGALRVVEDTNVAFLRADAGMLLPYPPVALIISPFIYFVMFAFTLAALVFVFLLSRRGVLDEYEPSLAAIGAVSLSATIGWLLYISATSEIVDFVPAVTIITLCGATLIAAVFWWASNRYAPVINEGTGYIGALIVWGHSVDGIANVLSLDWTDALGVGVTYSSKHVVNEATVRITESLQPAWLSEAIGTAWPFLLIKVAAAIFVVWVFNDEIFDDSPRYAYLLLIAILAVGLGPGTRDMIRATLAI
ncbi:MAG: DUF63 family protein [Natronomonas sp.]|jgi:uncharacterized membrane protein|uniref:DUF63 family protein n=1 Tax=Natronomonas sp. TaxID=2184060 RepID=UPI00286FBB28|nr:DUF63 family protein [Natronomonas sp.]MDR9431504.1 DUF63 family protein [Natronomonas sp.]